jgi:hypothetical protein
MRQLASGQVSEAPGDKKDETYNAQRGYDRTHGDEHD